MKKGIFTFLTGWSFGLLIAGFHCLLSACQQTTVPAVTNPISDEQMAHILADLNLAEAATTTLNGYAKDSLMQVYFQQVMDMHRTTKAAYETNLRAIATDPVRMDQLLDRSEDLLQDTLN